MTIDLSGIGINYQAVAPLLVVSGFALLLLLLDLVVPPDRRAWLAVVSALGLLAGVVTSVPLLRARYLAFGDTIAGDAFTAFFNILLCLIGACVVSVAPSFLKARGLDFGEFYPLVLSAVAGMMLLAAATSLMTIFLGIELLSLALYVLCAFARSDPKGQEAALKYLLLGGFASGFLLYGMALMYGATGSTTLRGITAFLQASEQPTYPLLLIGVGLLAIGFAFKVSAAPFHMWTPDVYEGAPTLVTGFMSVATKVAAFAALLRVFLVALPALHLQWTVVLSFVAATSMVLGSVVALAQDNLKRLLAYSGIGHAGFILLGVIPNSPRGMTAAVFYLAAYTVMNFGAFVVLTALAARGEEMAELRFFRGLAYRQPWLAAAMTVFFLSLGGFPPTVGFLAKLFVFQASIEAHLWSLVAIGILASLVSIVYYLRVVVLMFAPAAGEARPASVPAATTAVLALSAVATVGLGIFPAYLFDWAQTAGRAALGL
jgi:NADH-quinone oxidoreductase subunit N